jgi:hypothetical protein
MPISEDEGFSLTGARRPISRRGNFDVSIAAPTELDERLRVAEQEWIDTALKDWLADHSAARSRPVDSD